MVTSQISPNLQNRISPKSVVNKIIFTENILILSFTKQQAKPIVVIFACDLDIYCLVYSVECICLCVLSLFVQEEKKTHNIRVPMAINEALVRLGRKETDYKLRIDSPSSRVSLTLSIPLMTKAFPHFSFLFSAYTPLDSSLIPSETCFQLQAQSRCNNFCTWHVSCSLLTLYESIRSV